MSLRPLITVPILLGLAAAQSGCTENPTPQLRQVPNAVAEIRGPDVDPVIRDDAGVPGQYTVEYQGEPVEVILDGTGSSDPDGRIVEYRWLSATPAGDGGVGRWLPPIDEDDPDAGVHSDWPDNRKESRVVLDQGEWSFSLWVTDDEGLTSDPATVTVTISNEGALMQACIDAAYDGLTDSCKQCVCAVSPTCRDVAIPDCDETCWGLISCVANMCPNSEDPDNVNECIIPMCGPFLGAADQATAAGQPCAGPCSEECASE